MRLVYRNKSGPTRNGIIKRLVLSTVILLNGVRHEACVYYGNKSGPTRNGLIKRLVLLTVVLLSGGYCTFTEQLT